ncbi:reverse transcriptase domain-containing protein [Tanacetum coccineum]
MKAYVDEMVIKSMDETDMMADIRETFERLQKINMKLNPKKCCFWMEEGRFLGHVVSKQSIKGNPTKIQALTSLKRPKTIKEVQSLNGKLAFLNKFLSKSAKKSFPFFKTLKGYLDKKDFTWTKEVDKAFEDLKRYIEKLPTLVAPKAEENLIVYLAASKECISAVLMAERGKDQRPIYFVSRVLQGAELNYLIMEKLVLALIHAARRLKIYFQARNIMAIKLGEHAIEFKPRNAVKAQILADFLAETKEEDEETDFKEKQQIDQTTRWKLYTDGASSCDGSRAGLMVVSPEGMEFTYALKFEFTSTNNKAEYEVVIAGLCIAKEMKIEEITVFVDSQLGIDIVGPLPEAPGRIKFLIVAVDYFTKWVKAKPLASVMGKHAKRTHKGWVDELPQVLWAHRTSLKRSNGESTFSLKYGTEAVLLIEISIPTKRTRKVDPAQNKKDLRINLEVLEEIREITAIGEAAYKKKLEQYYNKKVRPSTYKPGDYVLRLNSASKVEYTGKMGPTWEGPYKVLKADGQGAYVLSTLKGRIIPRTWNGVNLRK